MERFDILDKNGSPTGLLAEKGAKLAPGQHYLGVHVYVFNAAMEFLIQQRAYHKKFLPGGWDVCLEHAMAGETSKECAVRGLQEELGLVVPAQDIQFVCRLVWEADHHIMDVYFVQAEFDISKLVLAPNEVIDAKGISKTEMLALINGMDYRPLAYRAVLADKIRRLTPCKIEKR
ncbi:MAG: NUDIX domain-containing protein [Defluviitaleaceae bacterium]|nr:NUDIX domain-containing protein [Defluviitaleaceae bacterium]